MFRYPTFKEGHTRSLTRSIIWRVMGIGVLALITYIYTQNWITTTLITVAHHGTFVFAYYAHERFWLRIRWLRDSKWKPFVRVITYEVILGNLVLGIISYIFTGSLQQMTLITLTYISNKYWMYYAYDYIWSKIRWQTTPTKFPQTILTIEGIRRDDTTDTRVSNALQEYKKRGQK